MALEEALLYFIDATTAGDQLIVLPDTITALSSSFPIAKSTLTEVFFPLVSSSFLAFRSGVAVHFWAVGLITLSTDSYFSVDDKRNWLLLHYGIVSLSLASELQVFMP